MIHKNKLLLIFFISTTALVLTATVLYFFTDIFEHEEKEYADSYEDIIKRNQQDIISYPKRSDDLDKTKWKSFENSDLGFNIKHPNSVSEKDNQIDFYEKFEHTEFEFDREVNTQFIDGFPEILLLVMPFDFSNCETAMNCLERYILSVTGVPIFISSKEYSIGERDYALIITEARYNNSYTHHYNIIAAIKEGDLGFITTSTLELKDLSIAEISQMEGDSSLQIVMAMINELQSTSKLHPQKVNYLGAEIKQWLIDESKNENNDLFPSTF